MPRRKAASNCTILPWLSGKQDCKDGRFIQIGNSLLLRQITEGAGNPFVNLPDGAKYLYFCMAMESGGKRCFQFPQAAARKYGIPPATLRRNIEKLIEAGMIKKESGKTVRQPNNYEFDFSWKAAK